MSDAFAISEIISDIFRLHSELSKKAEEISGKIDGCMSGIYPILLAMLFLHEKSLSKDFRICGAKVLLGHDLIKNTTVKIPEWCLDSTVDSLIQELIFADEQAPSTKIMSLMSPEAVLINFYELVGRLIYDNKTNLACVEDRWEATEAHFWWVAHRHPKLKILKVSRGLIPI